jgi:hypothetical protein
MEFVAWRYARGPGAKRRETGGGQECTEAPGLAKTNPVMWRPVRRSPLSETSADCGVVGGPPLNNPSQI